MFDHLLESSRRDDSNKWSNIGFGVEIDIIELKICTLSWALNGHIVKLFEIPCVGTGAWFDSVVDVCFLTDEADARILGADKIPVHC